MRPNTANNTSRMWRTNQVAAKSVNATQVAKLVNEHCERFELQAKNENANSLGA